MMADGEDGRRLSQEWFTTWEVAPGVICFAEDQHEQEVRSYLVRGSVRSLLWDAGMGVADLRREVEQFVAVRPETLLMVCSHSHFDHIGDVWRFAVAVVPVALPALPALPARARPAPGRRRLRLAAGAAAPAQIPRALPRTGDAPPP